jgi:hypothetical protein
LTGTGGFLDGALVSRTGSNPSINYHKVGFRYGGRSDKMWFLGNPNNPAYPNFSDRFVVTENRAYHYYMCYDFNQNNSFSLPVTFGYSSTLLNANVLGKYCFGASSARGNSSNSSVDYIFCDDK